MFAEKNNGAYFNNHRVRVSNKNEIDNCLFATGGKLKSPLFLTGSLDVLR